MTAMYLDLLTPQPLWRHFTKICQYPHGSKNEEPLRRYLLSLANTWGIYSRVDRAGNLYLRKPATPGMEDRAGVILQCHLDMVCEKNANADHDFSKDPIQPYIKDGWVRTPDTTLGADNGIGIAAALAVLEGRSYPHGPLECLFTVEEEIGLTGALQIEPRWLEGRILINLDHERDDEICIGCAGSETTIAHLSFREEHAPVRNTPLIVSVSGLKGGHSGLEVHLNRGNANKILARLLLGASQRHSLRLAYFKGGSRRNAIPREAQALLTVPVQKVDDFVAWTRRIEQEVRDELGTSDPDVHIELRHATAPNFVVDRHAQSTLLRTLAACPNGVITMDPDIPGLVRTSTNLATVTTEQGSFTIGCSQRSMVESEKAWLTAQVESVFHLAGAAIDPGRGYPAWRPRLDSEILKVSQREYEALFGCPPRVNAVHAGLECGIIAERYPGLDMVSIGPTIENAHSPNERVEIASVERFWAFLLRILEHVPRINRESAGSP